MTEKVVILGAGGHAQVVADILWRMYEADKSVHPVGFLDDNEDLWGKSFLGLPVLGGVKKLYEIAHDGVVIAIGDNRARQQLASCLEEAEEKFVVAKHPSAVIAPDVKIGRGTMICAGVVVNTSSVIEEHVILNTGCTIDHHNKIRSFAQVAPGAHTGGEVLVDTGAFVGIGASVLPRVSVGEWSVVGAGAVVTQDVPPGVTAVGVPAKPIGK